MRFFTKISLCLSCIALTSCSPTLQTPSTPAHKVSKERAIQQHNDVYSDAQLERQSAGNHPIIPEKERVSPARLWNVAFPLLKAGVGMFQVPSDYSYGFSFERNKNEPYFTVTWAHPEGPAGEAGVRPGDRILAINGIASHTLELKKAIDIAQKQRRDGPLKLSIEHAGEEKPIQFKAVAVLPYSVEIADDKSVNAYADGSKVVVMTGMMRFARTDTELAVVLGHELSHNGLGHVQKKMANMAAGSLLDYLLTEQFSVQTYGALTAAASITYSQAFEKEADYAGLYLVARAGMDISTAPYFWRRMGRTNPGSTKASFLHTHPSTPERFVALDRTIHEIQRKQREHLPLIPNMKYSPSNMN